MLVFLRIVVFVAFGLFLIWVARTLVLFSAKRKLIGRVEKRFMGQKIVLQALNANFFGLKSKGIKQIRGNGALVLTEIEIWFCLAMPEREISIPIRHIQSVELTKSHLGKTVFRPLLCLEFHSRMGADSIAWHVDNAGKWKTGIEGIMASSNC